MSIAPGVLFTIAGFPVTNTILATLLTDAAIITIVILLGKTISLRPGRLQNIFESVVEYFYNSVKDIAGQRASFIYPWVTSFFIFIVAANLIEFIPGFESVRFLPNNVLHEDGEHGFAFLRAATSDLNLTLALAVITVIASHYYSIKETGFKSYLSRFISLKMFPIMLFVGFLEFISELVKFVSFSFRLFGNIYAGDMLLEKTFYFVMPLEVFVGLIQALVFAMLTMAFMNILTEKHH
ncbi:MAG: F0F1 ATP synthase subunit A [Endomicrobium sp.]|jgi:F-type H+-transporting ATPase subunit a|nr:F0F1 ATP synthase subunit A [Endomicrobium sp.]